MKNYKELCSMLGIEERETRLCGFESAEQSQFPECEDGCEGCKEFSKTLPEFTSDKQLKMIELMLNRDFTMDLKISYINGKWFLLLLAEECPTSSDEQLSEAIAGLVNQLIKLGLMNRETVKRVIEQ